MDPVDIFLAALQFVFEPMHRFFLGWAAYLLANIRPAERSRATKHALESLRLCLAPNEST